LFTRCRHFDELSESIREHLDEKIADLPGPISGCDPIHRLRMPVPDCLTSANSIGATPTMADGGIHCPGSKNFQSRVACQPDERLGCNVGPS
jgi:hypothetical protein